jgi:radical SAM protein with 4Fe4S-binding SPASM domain
VPLTADPPLPADIQIEVTASCNLRCAMCLVRYRPPINKVDGAMSWDMFTRLIDDLPDLRRVTLQGLGEPLLAPRLLDMVAYVKRRGAQVGFNSNATLLRRRTAEALVASGLDWLHVSLDGSDAATFEAIRDGASFDTVCANLAGLVEAKERAGRATPWIRVVFVAMRRNIAGLPDLVRLLGRLGVSELRVQNLSHDFSDTDPAGRYAEIQQYAQEEALWTGADRALTETAFAAARRVARETGLVLRLPSAAVSGAGGGGGCTWPWESVYVTSAGVVQPCCMVMGDDRVALGNLAEQPLAQIWTGPAYREFRARLAGDRPPEVCVGCSIYLGTF